LRGERASAPRHEDVFRETGGELMIARNAYFVAGFAAILSSAVAAKVPPEEAARLGLSGTELTPVGAIRAGNVDGSIPAWEGGITQPPAGYENGKWYVDPYPDDAPVFTVTAQNYAQYEKYLAPGQIALLQKYPDTFRLPVYPTRRSASYPQWYYEGSIYNAAHTQFCNPPPGPNREERCLDETTYKPGVFFPIPKTGAEAQWNHLYAYHGKYWETTAYAFNVYPDGTYAEHAVVDRWVWGIYLAPEEQISDPVFTRRGGATGCFSQEQISPPRNAGQIFGGCTYLHDTDFDAYLYVPGQRRVRKAPEIGFYDSPGTGSDGLRTADQRFLFAITGSEEWYDYKPPVLREMIIPYNSYKLASPEYDFTDIVKKGHINSDLKRYELHRVWVVEGTLKPGFRHLGPHRLVYLDEDSWWGVYAEMHDQQGQLWRVSEAYPMNFYNLPAVVWWGEAHMDLINGRYSSANAWYNHGAKLGTLPPNYHKMPNPAVFTPAGLRKYGVR
jgi:hypothetical protein